MDDTVRYYLSNSRLALMSRNRFAEKSNLLCCSNRPIQPAEE